MPSLFNWTSSIEAEIRNRRSWLASRRRSFHREENDALVRDANSPILMASSSFHRKHLNREAALLSFCDPISEKCIRLQDLSSKEWSRLLHWLDVSGLALYFLDRMVELQWSDQLPAKVVARLEKNLQDNRERTRGMRVESVRIQQDFQNARVRYATLKGFSLSPHSVPRPELRHQFDLDFLIERRSAAGAREILERRGYRLDAVSGRSWEFKRHDAPGNIRDFYKDLPRRSVELHLEAEEPGYESLLQRVEMQEFYGIEMPVLSPVDLFIGQGLHAYKHVCSEFSRASHLLEFRRHVLSRERDDSFWKEVQARADGDVKVSVGLGIVTLLITRVMGDFAPEGLTDWTVRRLPKTVCLWVQLYAGRVVFGNTPGSKLYLLLERELESEGVRQRLSLRRAFVPLRLPPSVIRGTSGETLRVRMSRYRLQVSFVLLRLRFHVVEGLRYCHESYRWRQFVNRVIG